MVACKDCGKEFGQRESMEQHYAAKHDKAPSNIPHSAHKKSNKKLSFAAVAVAAVLIIGYFVFFSDGGSEAKPLITGNSDYEINLDEVPKRPIHWHPKVMIIIRGEQRQIPRNLGVGSVEYPVHTHEDVPILHYESNRPTPETMVLGYFFHTVWRKTFDNNCIFEYCNGQDGNLTMSVNGEPNLQFDKYIPKDGDDIVIRFE